MKVAFIYMPNSGDRVFAGEGRGVGVAEYFNGCRHVACFDSVRVEASDWGSWFRSDARRLLEKVVDKFGGVAWGEVHYAAPTEQATVVATAGLAHLAGLAGNKEEAERLMMQLWMMAPPGTMDSLEGPKGWKEAPRIFGGVWKREPRDESYDWEAKNHQYEVRFIGRRDGEEVEIRQKVNFGDREED